MFVRAFVRACVHIYVYTFMDHTYVLLYEPVPLRACLHASVRACLRACDHAYVYRLCTHVVVIVVVVPISFRSEIALRFHRT